MKPVDLTFNEFQRKSISNQCGDKILKFSEDTYDAGMVFTCTIIDVFDKDNNFCKRYISAISLNGSFKWQKIDILDIVDLINSFVFKNDIVVVNN